MNPRRYLPSQWHQAARSATAERVPLARPYLDSDPLDDWPPSRADCAETPADWRPAPTRRPPFIPQPRESGSGRQPRRGGAAATAPQPQLVPRQQPGGDGRLPEPGGYPASTGPHPPVTPWRPAVIDRPRQAETIERPSPVRAIETKWQEPVVERARQERAVIADEIRIPILWCEFGRCIAWYAHADALGERDLRARALADGWRYDGLCRLACPACAQCDASFWSTRPPAPLRRH